MISDGGAPDHDLRTTTRDRHTEPKAKPLLRAQTPAEIHRKEWLAAERAAGRPRPVADADAWDEWREKFDSITADQHRILEQRAAHSKCVARANRAARSVAGAQRAHVAPKAAAPVAPTTMAIEIARPVTEASVAASSNFGWPSSTVSLSGVSSSGGLRGDVAVPNFLEQTSLMADTEFPLGHTAIATHGAFQRAEQDWKRRCCQYAQRTNENAFPDDVSMINHCRAMCGNLADPESFRLFCRACAALKDAAARFSSLDILGLVGWFG